MIIFSNSIPFLLFLLFINVDVLYFLFVFLRVLFLPPLNDGIDGKTPKLLVTFEPHEFLILVAIMFVIILCLFVILHYFSLTFRARLHGRVDPASRVNPLKRVDSRINDFYFKFLKRLHGRRVGALPSQPA